MIEALQVNQQSVARIKRPILLIPFDDIKVGTERSYSVKHLLPRIGLVVIWGPPKCGKSFWTLDLVMHIALGWTYRDRRVNQTPVVYLALEGSEGFKARIEAFRLKFLEEREEPVPFFLIDAPIDLVKDQLELIKAISAQAPGQAPGVVVIDTLNRSLVGSESDDKDMANYVRAADAIRGAFNCLVIIVHHCGLDASRPRGHTSLTAAVDAQVAVKKASDGTIVSTVERMKDGPEGDAVYSQLESLRVGTDPDEDPITSCVIVPVMDAGAGLGKHAGQHPRESAAMRTFREAFNEAFLNGAQLLRITSDGPEVKAVHLKDVQAKFNKRYATAHPDQKKRKDASRQALKRSLDKLIEIHAFATRVANDEDWVWKVAADRGG